MTTSPQRPDAQAQPRYEARCSTIETTAWLVQDGKRVVMPPLTEAEAKILAFSLNAVAEGLDLMAGDYNFGPDVLVRRLYDGPTLLSEYHASGRPHPERCLCDDCVSFRGGQLFMQNGDPVPDAKKR